MYENLEPIAKARASAVQGAQLQLGGFGGEPIAAFLSAMHHASAHDTDGTGHLRTRIGNIDITDDLRKFERGPMARANAISRAFRANPKMRLTPGSLNELMKGDAFAKADLDVGTLTNLAQVTGGQALGFVSLDTNMARSTIRPGSFTLYQMLKKTRANQIVDFWPTATETGGALPGAAFNAYSSVNQGALATSAGQYEMNTITLRMALDGRAITAALAAQNSYVDVTGQETTNAALVVLQSLDWALYWGGAKDAAGNTLYPNQPVGLYETIKANAPNSNVMDFQEYKTAQASKGLSDQQLLFNLMFQQVAEIVKYRTYGIPTHAVMGVGTAGDLQQLITMQLQQQVNVTRIYGDHGPIVVNGNLQGMNTRFGDIHFPVDLLMTARDMPAAAITYADGTQPITVSNPTKPASVTVVSTGSNLANSDWTSDYCASGGVYTYAVSSTDSLMNESGLTYSAAVSGVSLLGSYVVTITPPAANDAYAFRVYRSGLGYNTTPAAPGAFRHIGDVIANGANNVTFTDLNAKIPGSETIFLLDMDEQDDAFDYRWLLPLSKIELFAQNLYMPWAVAHIGAPRVRIPRFHGLITNYVPQRGSGFDPLRSGNTF